MCHEHRLPSRDDQASVRSEAGGRMPARFVRVFPPEHYAEAHISGAINACAYDVTFMKEMEDAVPDKRKTVVVYGSGAISKAPEVAVKKVI